MTDASPTFSLVVATKGRFDQIEQLLDSLCRQTEKSFDVTVVDQNEAPILVELLGRAWPFPVNHIWTPGESGACRARNVGWREAQGAFILFPDDDCWYPPGFLEIAARALSHLHCGVLTGRAADEAGRSINGRFRMSSCAVKRSDVWTTSIEWVAFFQRSVLEDLSGFDEEIGIGALTPWQSCESQDIVLRALSLGVTCQYDPGIFGHHAELNVEFPDAAQIRKGRGYARGMGWVLRKHHSSWSVRLYWAFRPLLKSFLRLSQGRRAAAAYYAGIALGRVEGARGRIFANI